MPQSVTMLPPEMLSAEERLLLARLDDVLARADGGAIAAGSAFLNLGEQYLCRAYLNRLGKKENRDYLFFGGYPFAERTLCFCFPAYLPETYEYDPACDVREALLADCRAEALFSAVRITGSGYRTLTHRDYLGALLALGVERHTLGDIAVPDDRSAIVIAKKNICQFLIGALERVGTDAVHVTPVPEETLAALPDTRRWEQITDTVASPRLDAVVAACAGIARDKAKAAVTAGLVMLDFRPVTAPDTEVPDGAYLSVRGVGRFYYEGTNGASRKGRLRIHAKKLI